MDKRLGLLFLWLLGLSLYDIRYRRVPMWMILSGGVFIAAIGIYECIWGNGNFAVLLSGMVPGMVLLLLALGTQKAGWADGIVLMFMGSILGLRQCILTVVSSLIAISVVSAVLLVLKKAEKGTIIPYVPFLTMGFVLCRLIGG